MTAVTDAAWIGLIPFLSMGGASLLLGKFPPSKKVEAFFQYLTAGLLIAIVGVHLLPDIFDREIASRKDSLVGVSIGLIFAWLFLAAVAHINDLLENKDPTSATDFELPKKEAKTEGGIVVESQHKKLLKGGEVIPLNLELSVIMNAVVDGFLIGLGIAEDKSGGILIAAGLSVEMALLGISLTAKVMSCTGSPIGMRLIAIMIPPFLLYIFCLIGAAAGRKIYINIKTLKNNNFSF